jgi:hypothetical protein
VCNYASTSSVDATSYEIQTSAGNVSNGPNSIASLKLRTCAHAGPSFSHAHQLVTSSWMAGAHDTSMRPLIAICGTTGVGKSQLAVELALRLAARAAPARWHGARIVNADAMQAYAGADVLTNKLPVPARRGVPHLLLGVRAPGTQYVVGEWVRDAVAAVGAFAVNHNWRETVDAVVCRLTRHTRAARCQLWWAARRTGCSISSFRIALPLARTRATLRPVCQTNILVQSFPLLFLLFLNLSHRSTHVCRTFRFLRALTSMVVSPCTDCCLPWTLSLRCAGTGRMLARFSGAWLSSNRPAA